MAAGAECQSLLLALPDPCLLAVLQCCAATDQHSLISAARAHSRLHQAAVLVLRSIRAVVLQQQKVDSVLLYLARHGKHVDSIDLRGGYTVSLQELPSNLQLSSLQLERFELQVQAGNGFQGVLGAAAEVAALKQLRLSSCFLFDSGEGLAAALSLLSQTLEHLSIRSWSFSDWREQFHTTVLQQLQQLTYLELGLARVKLQGPDEASHALQPLQALTQLVDLRFEDIVDTPITASTLSGAHKLTRLHISGSGVEPGALAGKTLAQLQHLRLVACRVSGGVAGERQLLSHLQPLQQLTRLDWQLTSAVSILQNVVQDFPPAAAYSALTASSKLQHLNVSNSRLPAGVWQHLFPAGRQLSHLTSLNISGVQQQRDLEECFAPAPAGSLLVSCCPNLGFLDMRQLQGNIGLLPALQGLSTLHTLGVGHQKSTAEHLLLLTQLKQLRALKFGGHHYLEFACRVPGDELLWRQVAQYCLRNSHIRVAEKAAAALAQ